MSVPAYSVKVRDRLAGHKPPPEGQPFVLLVTGSRRAEWGVWLEVVTAALVEVNVWLELVDPHAATRPKILRHGAANGIDTMAHARARHLGYHRDPMRADWKHWGRRSGIIRNAAMVDKQPRPWVCLAFFAESSRGTADCAEQARRAGILTIPITVEDLYLPHAQG